MNKLYLLDGMSIAFRSYYGLQKTAFTNKEGIPTAAIIGFVNTITLLLEKLAPEYIAVVFDCREPTFRHKLYPAYKANRKKFPEELGVQLPYIKRILNAAGIKCIEIPGFEADDIIGTLSRQASEENYQTYCFTADKDFLQLLDEKTFIILNKKSDEFKILGINEVKEHFGVNANEVIDYLALIGDSSDNIPGVKGIGEKTAIPLIEKYHTLENIYDNIEDIEKQRTRNLLISGKEDAFLSKKLATIDRYVELNFDNNNPVTTDMLMQSLLKKEYHSEELIVLFEELNFKQIYERWRKLSYITKKDNNFNKTKNIHNNNYEQIKTIYTKDINYIYVDISNINAILADIGNSKNLAILIDKDSDERDIANITGIAFCNSYDKVYYLHLATTNQQIHADNLFDDKNDDDLFINHIFTDIYQILKNRTINKIGYDIKNTIYIIQKNIARFINAIDNNVSNDYNEQNETISPITFDVVIAGFLIDTNNNLSLSALSQKYLNYLPDDNIDTLKKTHLIYCLYEIMQEKINFENLMYVANHIEFPLIEVLVNMELEGISIDTNKLLQISEKLISKIDKYKTDIFKEAGIEFNIDSTKQLGDILFNKMKLSTGKKTKTRYSTDIETLSKLSLLHPIAEYVLEYRKLVKLKNTYIDALPKLINPKTDKIHTTFNQTIANTGRLSSTAPNLQNIPIRTEIGKQIRAAFIPKDSNFVIMSADYSQIELRIMAYLSKDENLINAFINGTDIHSATAALLYNINSMNVNSEMRRTAKAVNFGIMYGLGVFGLSQRLQITRNAAEIIINNYFLKFPGIKTYIDNTLNFVRKNGYTETMTGRKRYFQDINHKNYNIRTATERAAINMPVQGSAADMIKIAMLNIHNLIKTNHFRSKMILQVHDELIFEVDKKELTVIKELVESQMIYAFPLDNIPLEVSIGVGNSWLEAHS